MTETNCHGWKQLAEAARRETDPKRLMELIEQLNRALDAHIKDVDPQPSGAPN